MAACCYSLCSSNRQREFSKASFLTTVETLHYEKESSRSLLSYLGELVDENDQLLWDPCGGYGSLWEWTLRQKSAVEVASYLLQTRIDSVPLNVCNPLSGNFTLTEVFGDPLSAPVVKIILDSGERLDNINSKTGDSVLHAIAKYCHNPGTRNKAIELLIGLIREMESPLLEVFATGEINFPDPNHRNKNHMTALHLSLENGDTVLADLLVVKLGASWTIKPYMRYWSGNKNYQKIKMKWESDYGLSSNSSEITKDKCVVCYEALDVPRQNYMMECCGALLHVECYRNYLARSLKPLCMFCNMLIMENILKKVPKTVYRKFWVTFFTPEAKAAAINARNHTAFIKYKQEIARIEKEKEKITKKYFSTIEIKEAVNTKNETVAGSSEEIMEHEANNLTMPDSDDDLPDLPEVILPVQRNNNPRDDDNGLTRPHPNTQRRSRRVSPLNITPRRRTTRSRLTNINVAVSE